MKIDDTTHARQSDEANTQRIRLYKKFTHNLLLPESLAWRTDMSDGAKLLYAKLRQYEGEKGEARPKVATLARDLGKGRRQIERNTAELVDLELIEVHLRRGQHRPSVYYFLDHPRLYEAGPSDALPAPKKTRKKKSIKVTSHAQSGVSAGAAAHVATVVPRHVANDVSPPSAHDESGVSVHVGPDVSGEEGQREEGQKSEKGLYEEGEQPALFPPASSTVQTASEADRRDDQPTDQPTARPTARPPDRPTARPTARPTDRPTPGSGSPPPLKVVPPLAGATTKAQAALVQRCASALAEAEQVWRVEMKKHHPLVPLDRTPWIPKTGEGKKIQTLLDGYGLELVLKYLRWVIPNWGMVVSRFAKDPNFTATPTTLWAQWKCKDLIAEAMGIVGAVTPAQQVHSLKERIKKWQREHPGELLPPDLAEEAYRAPKLRGDKV